MAKKALMTSPYTFLTKMAYEIAKKIGIQIEIIEAAFEDALEKIDKHLKNSDIGVIISRGGTAALIQKRYNIPLFRYDPTDWDVIEALWKAKQIGGNIGYLGYRFEVPTYDIETIAQMLEIDANLYFYRNSDEYMDVISRMKADGIQVIAGGGQLAMELARQMGMQPVSIAAGKKTVTQVLERAKDFIDATRKEREGAEWLRTIVNYSHEGIIAVDIDDTVTVFNSGAQKIFNLPTEAITGKNIDATPLEQNFKSFIKNKQKSLDQLNNVMKTNIVCNRVPISINQKTVGVVVTFLEASRLQKLEEKIRKEIFAKGLVAKYNFDDIITCGDNVNKTIERAKRYGNLDATVLIVGESGTGKELFAQSMHLVNEKRRDKPFVAINCAALPENLLESELFGYEEGAFTGARKGGKPGLFELAHFGTIFLDEVDKMSLNLQGRLLRVLQEKEVMRVGGDRVIPVDVRVIAATNAFLPKLIEGEHFRKDLYYRLNTLTLSIPPLRMRKKDVQLLAEFFFNKFKQKYNKNITLPNRELFSMLGTYNWPGNVRELEGFMERYVINSDNGLEDEAFNELFNELIQEPYEARRSMQEEVDIHTDKLVIKIGSMEDMKRQIIEQLSQQRYRTTELADILGVARSTIWKSLKNNK